MGKKLKNKQHFAGGANVTGTGPDSLAALLDGKADASGLVALAPLAADATLPQAVERLNALLAALKV